MSTKVSKRLNSEVSASFKDFHDTEAIPIFEGGTMGVAGIARRTYT